MKNSYKYLMLLIPLLLFCQGKAPGQTIGVTAGSTTSCAGSVIIPITLVQMNNAGAISLTLEFDGSKLMYTGYQNTNPALTGGITVINGTANRVFFSWAGTAPATISNGTLVELLFTSLGQTSSLQWITAYGQCEFSDMNGQPIQAQYTNGAVTSPGAVPLISQEPANFTAIEGISKVVSIAASGAGTYQWQVSQNNGNSWTSLTAGMGYTGFNTAALTITAPALGMNGYAYRCIAAGACPPADTSDAAIMTVLSKVTITAHNRNSCADTITIPVSVKGFVNIGAVSLVLSHDTVKAAYTGYQKVNAVMASGNLMINDTGGKVYLSWAGTTPLSLPDNDTLIELRFLFNGLNTNLTWQTTAGTSEIADINGNPLQVTYVNSALSSPGQPPSINTQPANKSVYTGQSAQFTITTSNATSRQWQVSTDQGTSWSNITNNTTYSGATTLTLMVSNVQITMDQYRYRCLVTGSCPPAATSQSAILSVSVQPPVLKTTIPSVQLCGQSVAVPVIVENFLNVGAVSLTLNYNASGLMFTGFSRLHQSLPSAVVSANAAGGNVYFTWASVDPGNIGNDTLVYLNFQCSITSASFTWDTQTTGNCEYSDINTQPILAQFVNGSVTIDTGSVQVSFSLQDTLFCSDDPPVILTAVPPNGVFSGPGVQGNTFTPSVAGYGIHQLNYTVTSSVGCSYHKSTGVFVDSPWQQTTFATVCLGSSYQWRTGVFSQSGNYYDSLISGSGCDSVFILNLNVLPYNTKTISADLCQGGFYFWNGQYLNTTGTYFDTISGGNNCDTVVQLNLTVRPKYLFTESQSFCLGTPFLWHGKTLTAGGTYYDSLVTAFGCDSVYVLQLTGLQPQFNQIGANICQGGSYLWNGQYLTIPGTYPDTLQGINGCDSIVILTLSVNPTYSDTLHAAICAGGSYLWQGTHYTTSGFYTKPFQTIHNCDSLKHLVLTVNPLNTKTINASICTGGTYYVGNKAFTTAGTYLDTIPGGNGCDTIVQLILTVQGYNTKTISADLCQGGFYFWNGQYLNTTGTYFDTISGGNNCDTLVQLNLTVRPKYLFTESQSFCIGSPYLWHGKTLTTGGTYYDSLVSAFGCDSVYMLQLTALQPQFNQIGANICQGGSYLWNGQYLTIPGIYPDTLQGINGCDSIVILTLSVNPTYSDTLHAAICAGGSYLWQGTHYTTSGFYTKPFQTINNCDSIKYLVLTVNPLNTKTINASICTGGTYYIGNKAFTTAGTYFDTIPGGNGCDTIVQLILTVQGYNTKTISADLCQGGFYFWNGQYLNTTGTYFDTISGGNNCDTVVQLNLMVRPKYLFTQSQSFCIGSPYLWHGKTLTTGGTYYDSLVSAFGCDSVYMLQLTAFQPQFNQIGANICQGGSYLWNGQYLTIPGTYPDTLQGINGCDSIVILTLSVNPTYSDTLHAAICAGGSYLWQGTYYTTSGFYTKPFQTIHNCDSLKHLVLTVNPGYNDTLHATICAGDSMLWQNQYYKVPGYYTVGLQTTQSCDSILTLHLTVNLSYIFPENKTICNGDTYLWFGTQYQQAGVYYHILQTTTGCDSIFVLTLDVTVVDTSVVQNGFTLTATATSSTFQWVDCNNGYAPIQGQTGSVFNPTVDGSYAVIVTYNNCTDTSSCYTIQGIGINQQHQQTMRPVLWPNPSEGVIWLRSDEPIRITISSHTGALISEVRYQEGIHTLQLPETMAPGVYLIRMQCGRSVYTERLVLIKP